MWSDVYRYTVDMSSLVSSIHPRQGVEACFAVAESSIVVTRDGIRIYGYTQSGEYTAAQAYVDYPTDDFFIYYKQ